MFAADGHPQSAHRMGLIHLCQMAESCPQIAPVWKGTFPGGNQVDSFFRSHFVFDKII